MRPSLGTTLATVLLDTAVSLAEGAVALLVLVLLQYVVSRSSLRWPAVERVVKSEPVLVYHRGFRHDEMRRRG